MPAGFSACQRRSDAVLTPASPLPARLTLTLTLCGTAAFGQALRERFAV